MPAVKHPCLQCKDKHVKCDEERPRCRRCQLKQLPCSRPAKKTVFKHGSVANFAKDQKWVSSEARHFRFHPRPARGPASPEQAASQTSPASDLDARSSRDSPAPSQLKLSSLACEPPAAPRRASRLTPPDLLQSEGGGGGPGYQLQPAAPPSMPSIRGLTSSTIYASPRPRERHDLAQSEHTSSPSRLYPHASPGVASSSALAAQPAHDARRRFPLQDVQEACLLRYFVEEISHWFDLCDQDRHFQLVVPVRARKHPHLLDAIFAVAARHLSRLPQYKTPRGILYHGQLLPNLDEHAAVEYMLKCIPALRQFHDVQDDEYRDSIITTAVILRQLEEIDHEDGGGSGYHGDLQPPLEKQVNFLAVIDAVLRSLPSQTALGQPSLMQAAYWMAMRQEIFNSFTRREAPQLMMPPGFWHNATSANKVVMHLVQTAKWHWGDGSEQEWRRLMDQQEHLEQEVLVAFQPLYQRAADKSRGEIFPTIWYGSNIEVTSVQLGLIAKSVLVAENPHLRYENPHLRYENPHLRAEPSVSRASWRHIENEVRVLLLELCGIALCNPASPPALVQASLGIGMYGDFFTDQYERHAIRTVVERYRDTHAWPVQRLLELFQ